MHSYLYSSYLVSHFLDSIRNMHDSVPGDKLTFILSVLSGPLKLLASLGLFKISGCSYCMSE